MYQRVHGIPADHTNSNAMPQKAILHIQARGCLARPSKFNCLASSLESRAVSASKAGCLQYACYLILQDCLRFALRILRGMDSICRGGKACKPAMLRSAADALVAQIFEHRAE